MRKKYLAIGIGGGGTNILNYLCVKKKVDTDFLAIDTDLQNLEFSAVKERLLVGDNGLGLGADFDYKKLKDDIISLMPTMRKKFYGYKKVCVISCLGGNTGSTIILPVLELLRDLKIKSLAIVIKPMIYECKLKQDLATLCLREIDNLEQEKYLLKNDDLLKQNTENKSLIETFCLQNEDIANTINHHLK